jgi:ParB family chromosome partitioning protein
MAQGNRGFAEGLAVAVPSLAGTARLPPRTGILGARDNRLAELASGNAITRVQELVDPIVCKIWEGHNRDYSALNPENCADLIESFKAQGRQEVPAIVRRLQGDPKYSFEVICGARRHWTVSWLKEHDYPDFKFLIEPRELTDEEAFRIADLENRNRRDLSDYERAHDYARAIQRYYEGSQQRMAERLEVTKSWLSRYLELAKLPTEIVSSFGSPHVIGISHAAAIAPLLRTPEQRDRVISEAQTLVVEQTALADRGASPLSPGAVVRRLATAGRHAIPPRQPRRSREHVVRTADGAILARGLKASRGGVAISLSAPAKHDRAVVLAAVGEILDRLSANQTGHPGER